MIKKYINQKISIIVQKDEYYFVSFFGEAWSRNNSETDLNDKRIIMKFILQQASNNKPKFL